MKNKPKFLIFDGNALVHRSFHALPPTMTTKSGEQVNAVYGFANFLLKAIKEFRPTYCAVTFDLKGPTFRHVEYEAYKATRVKAPQELYDQFDRVKEIVRILQIPIFEVSGFEADDVIGTLADQLGRQVDTIIVTGDMDAIQLVDDSTFVYAMSRGISDSVLYDTKAVRARYGFEPLQLIDYKALRGDTSDNIPGVKGIGEKTGTELVKTFGSLETLYQALDSNDPKLASFTPRILDLLKTGHDSAVLSKRLATIRRDAPIDFHLDNCRFGSFSLAPALELFTELEFRSLLPRLKELTTDNSTPIVKDQSAKATTKKPELVWVGDYQLVNDSSSFDNLLSQLSAQTALAIQPIFAEGDDLLGLSFCWQDGLAYFLALPDQQSSTLFAAPTSPDYLKALAPVFANAHIKKYAHNLKVLIKTLADRDLILAGAVGDVLIASYLLNPDSNKHELADLAAAEFALDKISGESLLGKGKSKLTWRQLSLEQVTSYAGQEADLIWRLTTILEARLTAEQLTSVYQDLDLPLSQVLARMESQGIILDLDYWDKLDRETDRDLAKLTKAIYKQAGRDFNINSIQQLRSVLFTDLGLSTQGISKTKTGFSTGAEELVKLRDLHPIVPLILDYRELAKLSSTYIKALPKLVDQATSRLHTSYNQTIAATGRLSSINPNLQNIPMRTEVGRRLRRGFIAPDGSALLSLDYSQIELRLAAHMSGDPTMIETFRAGGDIHQATAAKINNIELGEVTKDMRSAAKAINFGLLYGQGPHGLAQVTGLSYADAKKFIDAYFANFASIKNYMDGLVAQARAQGFVETLLGRKRYLPNINSKIVMLAKAAERAAINAPIQGTAADMIKLAMIKIDQLIQSQYADRVKMLLQVHDELVFELPKNLVTEFATAIKPLMENVLDLSVPIVVDAKVGENWEEMTKL